MDIRIVGKTTGITGLELELLLKNDCILIGKDDKSISVVDNGKLILIYKNQQNN